MKKFLTIAVAVLALGVIAMWAWGHFAVKANDEALAQIKQDPAAIVLKVDGMT